jgi:hypothetical protein
VHLVGFTIEKWETNLWLHRVNESNNDDDDDDNNNNNNNKYNF